MSPLRLTSFTGAGEHHAVRSGQITGSGARWCPAWAPQHFREPCPIAVDCDRTSGRPGATHTIETGLGSNLIEKKLRLVPYESGSRNYAGAANFRPGQEAVVE